ncbi:MAG: N-6 DNA methylase [Verrucomicrobia bacterium]|nr:N-6 DNA methylase [Verrucomicrobiota bacterium]
MPTSTFEILPIRRALIEADLVDCMVALPGQLFMATEKFNVALAA